MQFSGKLYQNNRLVPPPLGLAPPPLENLGSATDNYFDYKVYNAAIYIFMCTRFTVNAVKSNCRPKFHIFLINSNFVVRLLEAVADEGVDEAKFKISKKISKKLKK